MTWWQRYWYRLLKLPLPPTDAAAGIPDRTGEAADIAHLQNVQEEQAKALALALLNYRRANMARAMAEEHNDA